MQHIFDVEIATNHGVNAAVFLSHTAFWIQKNMANNKHNHNGRYWTYNTQEALLEIFPYWSRQNLRTTIDYCLKNDLIIKGNFNEIKYDRTCWYSLTDKGLSLFKLYKSNTKSSTYSIGENQPIDFLKPTNQNVGINPPIPDINTDNKPYIKDKDKAQPKKQVACEDIHLPDWLPKELWDEFKQHRKEIKKPMSALAQKKTIAQLDKMRSSGQDIVSVINQSIANGWQGIFELKSQGRSYGKDEHTVNKNGFIEPKRNWATEQWAILKEGCGLPRDADLNQIKGIIPGEVWDDLPDPGRDYDCKPSLDYHSERDF